MSRRSRPGMSPSELVVLGVALAHPHRAGTALDDLEPADFHSPQHGAVLTAIHTLVAHGQVPEPSLVIATLERQHGIRPLAAEPWGIVVHNCLSAMCTMPEGCRPHRIAVLEARLRRETYDQARLLAHLASGPLGELHDALNAVVSQLGRTLARIAEQTHPAEPRKIRAINRNQEAA
ncbi:hypothetical protein Kisp01_11810 [Kineosporia sp. NBRC 101677]|uniref:DnaB-like helicase N-terminal domain-containing protein n=1 Tax=Kineosporia sp. NBRC 101677 TaxID=3032197 RepID=UPI0024A2338D|nr:DnaB-like helicase N-terminal domain-containing protein [Kineosporia sp. NBRC 101677]GLY14165.1 hypothetical protein Kisp01_11810 [Kineosporia sp. NBRC 101677]